MADETLMNPSIADNVAVEQNHENSVSDTSIHRGMESDVIFSKEEVRGALETSAFTGKFWQDWEKLRSILSYHLKQVLSEYPEAKMSTEQQTASLGETFQDLVKRLNNALHTFVEGPPFTLQRLCEILLSARSIYPKLSKLSLALEKNLLVTSTLTMSADPSPPVSKANTNGACEESGNAQPQTNSLENGVESAAAAAAGDRDEIMTEVEEAAEVDEEMTTMDMETIEGIVRSSEANPTPTVESS